MKRLRAYVGGQYHAKAQALTEAQWRMLFDIRDHGDPMFSRYDRAAGTLRSLQRLGFVRGEKLTAEGERVCAVEWRHA